MTAQEKQKRRSKSKHGRRSSSKRRRSSSRRQSKQGSVPVQFPPYPCMDSVMQNLRLLWQDQGQKPVHVILITKRMRLICNQWKANHHDAERLIREFLEECEFEKLCRRADEPDSWVPRRSGSGRQESRTQHKKQSVSRSRRRRSEGKPSAEKQPETGQPMELQHVAPQEHVWLINTRKLPIAGQPVWQPQIGRPPMEHQPAGETQPVVAEPVQQAVSGVEAETQLIQQAQALELPEITPEQIPVVAAPIEVKQRKEHKKSQRSSSSKRRRHSSQRKSSRKCKKCGDRVSEGQFGALSARQLTNLIRDLLAKDETNFNCKHCLCDDCLGIKTNRNVKCRRQGAQCQTSASPSSICSSKCDSNMGVILKFLQANLASRAASDQSSVVQQSSSTVVSKSHVSTQPAGE